MATPRPTSNVNVVLTAGELRPLGRPEPDVPFRMLIILEKAVALSDWIRFGGEPRRRTGGREHEFGKCALKNRAKPLHIRPLLRRGLQGSQEACPIRQHGLYDRLFRMRAGNRQTRLSPMSGLRVS